jgi:hypothetical protein
MKQYANMNMLSLNIFLKEIDNAKQTNNNFYIQKGNKILKE